MTINLIGKAAAETELVPIANWITAAMPRTVSYFFF